MRSYQTHEAHLAVLPQPGAVAGHRHSGRLPLAGGAGPEKVGRHQGARGEPLEIPPQGPMWVSSKSLMASTRLRSALA